MKFTLDILASQSAMSRSKFSARFREAFGMTPFAYIRQEKIRTAKHLPATTDDPVCRISDYLQFHDQSYFTNIFRQVAGMTPREYRKEHKR